MEVLFFTWQNSKMHQAVTVGRIAEHLQVFKLQLVFCPLQAMLVTACWLFQVFIVLTPVWCTGFTGISAALPKLHQHHYSCVQHQKEPGRKWEKYLFQTNKQTNIECVRVVPQRERARSTAYETFPPTQMSPLQHSRGLLTFCSCSMVRWDHPNHPFDHPNWL